MSFWYGCLHDHVLVGRYICLAITGSNIASFSRCTPAQPCTHTRASRSLPHGPGMEKKGHVEDHREELVLGHKLHGRPLATGWSTRALLGQVSLTVHLHRSLQVIESLSDVADRHDGTNGDGVKHDQRSRHNIWPLYVGTTPVVKSSRTLGNRDKRKKVSVS